MFLETKEMELAAELLGGGEVNQREAKKADVEKLE